MKACLFILALTPEIYLLAAEKQALPSRVVPVLDGSIELGSLPDSVKTVSGYWRFAERHIQTMSPEEFSQLPLKNALRGLLQYQNLAFAATDGAYILKIKAAESMPLTLRFGGMVASGEFKLLSPTKSTVLYQSFDFKSGSEADGRNQIMNILLNLQLEPGESYLVYNYHQKPFSKANTPMGNTGLVGPMQLGSAEAIKQDHEMKELFLKIPLGVFACLSIYSLLIFFSRRGEDRVSLVLCIFNGLIFLKEVFSQAIYLPFFQPNFFAINISAIVYSMTFAATSIAIHLLNLKKPTRYLRFFFYLSLVNCTLCALNGPALLNIEFLPDTSVLNLGSTLLNGLIFFVFVIPYSIYSARKTKDFELIYLAIGLFLLGLGSIIDFINTIYNYGWPWLSMWGGMALSIVLAKNNSLMFARAFDSSKKLNIELETKNQEVQALNENLETKVHERTAEIKGLLEHIPQGILSITLKGLVEANYSAHLPKILEHNSIAGQSFKSLVFDNCLLSEDEKDQAWQTILASIGETSLNFEMNCDKLPSEVACNIHQKKKILKFTWNIEIDSGDEVKRILVTILDITEEYEARQELEEKNKDLAIIKQLIEIGVKKSSQFFGTAGLLMDENERLLKIAELNTDALKILFVNAHTIKGAARTLQLKDLSGALHEVEFRYASCIKGTTTINRDLMIEEMHGARKIFAHYLKANRDVLGRSDDFSKIQIDRNFLEQHYQLLRLLGNKIDLDANITGVIHKNRDELTRLIFMSLESVLQEAMSQAAKIAKDLQKEAPIINTDICNILISHQQEVTIKNSFIHILRNALDHGIESAEERKLAGKNPHGTLFVRAWEDPSSIHLEVWDDGRGLAIQRLRSKALASGLITADASLQSIANSVFTQGITTAASVSQISGRGIGMDAVKRFFEADGGTIQIQIDAPSDIENQYYKFKFHMSLPKGSLKESIAAVGKTG